MAKEAGNAKRGMAAGWGSAGTQAQAQGRGWTGMGGNVVRKKEEGGSEGEERRAVLICVLHATNGDAAGS